VQGVDISRYQPDYQPRAEDHFVIIKATEGRTSRNLLHDDQVARCRAAGKIIGHYHWLWPGNIEGQLDWFATHAKVQPGDIIALDWENPAPNLVPKADMESWLRAAVLRWPENRVIVYTFPCYAPFQAAKGVLYRASGLWIADYRERSAQLGVPHACDGQLLALPWLIWQYTSKPFDHNRAQFATPAEMLAWARGLIPQPPGEEDMDEATLRRIVREELERQQYIDKVAVRVLTLDGVIESKGFVADPTTNPWVTLETAVKTIRNGINEIRGKV
jgi:hypothetical protein